MSFIPEYLLRAMGDDYLGMTLPNIPCSCHLEPLFQAPAAVHRAEGWDQQPGRWIFTLSFTRFRMICPLSSPLSTGALVETRAVAAHHTLAGPAALRGEQTEARQPRLVMLVDVLVIAVH
jgi:hypothetical protein